MMILKNWSIRYKNPTFFSELAIPCLTGEVYHHPRFPDGARVTTSSVKNIEDCETYKKVKTRNSIYMISPENVDPEYEKEYPDAYNRLSIIKE